MVVPHCEPLGEHDRYRVDRAVDGLDDLELDVADVGQPHVDDRRAAVRRDEGEVVEGGDLRDALLLLEQRYRPFQVVGHVGDLEDVLEHVGSLRRRLPGVVSRWAG